MHTLIFCNTGDVSAQLLHDHIFHKGERELRLVTEQELAFASWLHEADSNGIFFTRIKLHDGFIIEPGMIKVLVNRISYIPMPQFIKKEDRLYAEMEILALFNSFLYSIEDKVVDGMPIKHLNTMENALLHYTLAATAGLDVMDNLFTSSPRWNQPKALKAMSPDKKKTVAWHRQSPHLVWENKPALFNEPFGKLVKATIVGDKIICTVSALQKLQQQIKKLSALLGRTVYEITMAETNGKYKLYEMNLRPSLLTLPAIEAFALLLAKKSKK